MYTQLSECQAPELNGRDAFCFTGLDMFACGVILFTMLVGRPPFGALGVRCARDAYSAIERQGAHAVLALARSLCADAQCAVCRDAPGMETDAGTQAAACCRVSSAAAELIAGLLAPVGRRWTLSDVQECAYVTEPPDDESAMAE